MIILKEKKITKLKETEFTMEDLAGDSDFGQFKSATIRCMGMPLSARVIISVPIFRYDIRVNSSTNRIEYVYLKDRSGKIVITLSNDMIISVFGRGISAHNKQMMIELFK